MPKIPIETVYMQTAYQFSKLSYAERRKVGCIIVKDHQVISFGYNGMPHGFNNKCEKTLKTRQYYENPEIAADLIEDGYKCDQGICVKESQITKPEVLHAESNAIMKVAKSTMSCVGAELYTTTCPCFGCSKLIIQAGILKVYYTETYRDMSGIDLLKRAGISVEQIIVENGI
jgi:dCMP deaminase